MNTFNLSTAGGSFAARAALSLVTAASVVSLHASGEPAKPAAEQPASAVEPTAVAEPAPETAPEPKKAVEPAPVVEKKTVVRMGLVVRPAEFNDNYMKGVDPFFPTSRRRYPKAAPTEVVSAPPTEEASGNVEHLTLKGITGLGSQRLALINNRTFAAGESAAVRTPTGQMKIRVLELGESSVKVTIGNEGKVYEIRLETTSYDFTQAR